MTYAYIKDGSIVAADLATDAVEEAKIGDGEVTNAKLDNSSVTIGTTSVTLGESATAFAGLGNLTFAASSALDWAAGAVVIGASIGTANLTLGGSNTTVIAAGDLTVTGDLLVSGDTTTVNTATLSVEDPLIILASGNNTADAVDIGMYGLYDTSGSLDLYSGLFRDANDSGKWKLFKDLQAAPTTTVNTGGTGYAVGTLVANLEGDVTGTASTATVATTVTITDNESTNEDNAIIFTAGGDVDGGNIGLESDGTLTYNPSTGTVTATVFSGALTGALTGNADTVTNGVYTTSKISALAATSSSELLGVISDETGSGSLVFATSPTLVTPALGTPSALVGTSISGTAASLTSGSVTVSANNSTAETVYPTFVDGATGSQGIETDTGLTYNPSTGLLSTAAVTTTGLVTAGNITSAGTWTFDEHTSGTVGIVTVQDSGTSFADNDTSFMTAAAIADKIEAYGYGSSSGDITAVVAGVGLSGGATSGSATVTVDFSEFSAVTPQVTDHLATLDVDGSTEQLTTISALDTLLSATSKTLTNKILTEPVITHSKSVGAVSASHTLSGHFDFVIFTSYAASGAHAVTLAAAGSGDVGKTMIIKAPPAASGKSVTIDANGSETIDGSTSVITLDVGNAAVTLFCGATGAWYIV